MHSLICFLVTSTWVPSPISGLSFLPPFSPRNRAHCDGFHLLSHSLSVSLDGDCGGGGLSRWEMKKKRIYAIPCLGKGQEWAEAIRLSLLALPFIFPEGIKKMR